MASKFRLLVSDINIMGQGHWLNQAQYILDNYKEVESQNEWLEFIFLFNKGGKTLLNVNNESVHRVHYMSIENPPEDGLSSRRKVLQEINEFCKSQHIDHLIFTDLDRYQLAFATIRMYSAVSGILYRPHHRIEQSNKNVRRMLSGRMMRLKKKFADLLLVQNSSFKNIFILNDKEGIDYLNKYFKTGKFKYLPDPIYRHDAVAGSAEMQFHSDRYKYLIFGAMDQRKNLENILRAYAAANIPVPSEILLIGKMKPGYKENIVGLINDLALNNESKRVYLHTQYVSNDLMEAYFQESDVCLLVYKDFFGSSGILGRVAMHGKKSIGANVGVISKLITDNNLGLVTDATNINKIAKSMEDIIDFQVDELKSEAFYHAHSPEYFLSVFASVEQPVNFNRKAQTNVEA